MLIALTASAQTPSNVATPNCSSAEHRQFDFWLGEWNVTQGEKPAGRNIIRSILNGCAISEEWSGTGGFKGSSLNFYNADTKRWHQTWIDSQGQSLVLEGQLEAGSMTLQSVAADSMPRHRITWTPMPDKSVRQNVAGSRYSGIRLANAVRWKVFGACRASFKPAELTVSAMQ